MKILLINPPGEFKTPIMPMGFAYISAYLKSKDKNIDIKIIDGWAERWNKESDFKKLKDRVFESKADIVGIYFASPRYNATQKSIETCRKALPNSIIIAGGPHPSALPIETLKEIPELDICAVGEGEITMHELIKSFENNSPLTEVSGLAFRNKENGEIIITKPREFIKNLDDLPFPLRDIFPLDRYQAPPWIKKRPCFPMITSRGCPYQCAYCSKDVFRDTFRARSPEKVCDEIEELIAKYGVKEIQFHDDDFTMDMQRAEKICDEILRRGIKISWSCLTRVNLVNEKLLRKMKEAGCYLVMYGMESGNQKILNAINKGFTIEQIVSAFQITRKIGLKTTVCVMVGLPGETEETVKDTFSLLKKIKPNFMGCNVLIVYPGSRFFKLIQSGKYRGRLRVLGNKTIGGTTGIRGNYTVFEDNFTFEELEKIAKKLTKEFFLRPQYLWQSLKDIRSFSDIRYYLNGAKVILKSLFV